MMKNNSKETEQLRLSLLRFLDASAEATSRGMAESLLWQMARNEGRTGLTLEEVRAELMYLKDRNLICEVPKPISPELRSWRITADEREFGGAVGVVRSDGGYLAALAEESQ